MVSFRVETPFSAGGSAVNLFARGVKWFKCLALRVVSASSLLEPINNNIKIRLENVVS